MTASSRGASLQRCVSRDGREMTGDIRLRSIRLRSTCRASALGSSQRAGKRAAVEQDVLAGDVARLGAAQERASEAKFFRIAEAAGGILPGAFGQDFIRRDAALLGFGIGNALE